MRARLSGWMTVYMFGGPSRLVMLGEGNSVTHLVTKRDPS